EARSLAAALTGGTAGNGSAAPRLRLFGGFSFRDVPGSDPFWAHFPAGLFVLPRTELQGDGGGSARLRVRARVAPGEDAEAVRHRLEREVQALAAELRRPVLRPVAPPGTEAGALVNGRGGGPA